MVSTQLRLASGELVHELSLRDAILCADRLARENLLEKLSVYGDGHRDRWIPVHSNGRIVWHNCPLTISKDGVCTDDCVASSINLYKCYELDKKGFVFEPPRKEKVKELLHMARVAHKMYLQHKLFERLLGKDLLDAL